MGSLFRSEPMKLCQVFLQAESAFDCMAELGEMGMSQFRDLNPDSTSFQRKYVNEVRRCDEMQRQLRYLVAEMKRESIKPVMSEDESRAPPPRVMVDLESQLDKLEADMLAINGNEETLRQNFLELSELKHILEKTQTFFDEHGERQAAHSLLVEAGATNHHGRLPTMELNGEPMKGAGGNELRVAERRPRTISNAALDLQLSTELENIVKMDQPTPLASDLSFVTGVIDRRRLTGFERLLWRACRGNIFVRWEEITEELIDPATREPVSKSVFIIFFQGERLKTRVKKICDAYHAKVYPCPATTNERREMSVGVITRLEDIKTVLNETSEHRIRTLVHASSSLQRWHQQVQKMKSIFHSLNLLNIDVTQKCLIGECWVPEKDLHGIRVALKKGDELGGATVPSILNMMESEETPPTFFRTNKVTQGYQNIVDSYGIANYGEVNPAPWTVITFPFLFAVMFGDVGHGMIMFLGGLTMVLTEKKLSKVDGGDIFDTFFGGRYVILMMGCFSMYTGFIYNDIYAKSWRFPAADTGWKVPDFNQTEKLSYEYIQTRTASMGINVYYNELDPKDATRDSIYWAGVDPIWNLAENKLLFIDSFKMKVSVILGISQMMFGVVLSLINHVHFKDYLRIWTEFIPEVLFLSSLFVYMCVLIVIKWLVFSVEENCNWPVTTDGWPDGVDGVYPGPHCAPSLLIGIINMALPTSSKGYGFVEIDNTTSPYHDDGLVNVTRQCGGLAFHETKAPLDCNLQAWYPYQKTIEPILVLIALVCVPWMLLIRPFVLKWRYGRELKKAIRTNAHRSSSNETHENPAYEQDEVKTNGRRPHAETGTSTDSTTQLAKKDKKIVKEEEEDEDAFSMGDTIVYQAIHTIEFALGCVSHTASYLRLWALSLAHSQLSEVLWSMVMRQAFTMGGNFGIPFVGGIVCYVVFMVFSVLTISILVFMEGLSAFLHALRLHWVEFQSKFYMGQGTQFTPFTFANLSKQIGEDEVVVM